MGLSRPESLDISVVPEIRVFRWDPRRCGWWDSRPKTLWLWVELKTWNFTWGLKLRWSNNAILSKPLISSLYHCGDIKGLFECTLTFTVHKRFCYICINIFKFPLLFSMNSTYRLMKLPWKHFSITLTASCRYTCNNNNKNTMDLSINGNILNKKY